jgi:hypothetical protein
VVQFVNTVGRVLKKVLLPFSFIHRDQRTFFDLHWRDIDCVQCIVRKRHFAGA